MCDGRFDDWRCVYQAAASAPDIALIKSELGPSVFLTGCRRLLDLILKALFSSAGSAAASPLGPLPVLPQCNGRTCRTV